MTMWLSVDPMTDKYPSINPYAYCAWNPVKLVDPDGMEAVDDWVKNKKTGLLIVRNVSLMVSITMIIVLLWLIAHRKRKSNSEGEKRGCG